MNNTIYFHKLVSEKKRYIYCIHFLIRSVVCVLLYSMSGGAVLTAQVDDAAARLVVVANSADPESMELARYYMDARSIPTENLVALPFPMTETLTWAQFSAEVYNPLRSRLIEDEWLNALSAGGTDSAGREIYSVFGHKISYLLLCRGVPLRIAEDLSIVKETDDRQLREFLRVITGSKEEAMDAAMETFKTNSASVDAELALMALGGVPGTSGPVLNPLFGANSPGILQRQRTLKVMRLDGPSLMACKAMVDSALAGEKYGLMGRAYIDQDGRTSGGYLQGNRWLSTISHRVGQMGFTVTEDITQPTFPVTQRFDAPAIYFGWWTYNADGPFLLPGFRLPPGAVAVHLHSFSADTLRKRAGEPESRWVGPLVASGAACTLGNVWEPYLQFTHHLDSFFEALTTGAPFGDAAYYALPVLSWQAIAVGDPLYRPFKVGLVEQLNNLEAPETVRHAQYVVINRMNLLEKDGNGERALDYGLNAYNKTGGRALALELARRLVKAGNAKRAKELMLIHSNVGLLPPDEWVLIAEIANFLHIDLGESKASMKLYTSLLEVPGLPPVLERTFLPDAMNAALGAGDNAQSRRWLDRLKAIATPAETNVNP